MNIAGSHIISIVNDEIYKTDNRTLIAARGFGPQSLRLQLMTGFGKFGGSGVNAVFEPVILHFLLLVKRLLNESSYLRGIGKIAIQFSVHAQTNHIHGIQVQRVADNQLHFTVIHT